MKLKKVLASILALAMVLSTMGTVAFAADGNVAKVGDTYYATLQAAFNAAKDNDIIVLQDNVTITEATRVFNSGSYYDGVYYLGDKNFTLDLNDYTLTHDGSVNDYLLNFKNMGDKANEITITNGTIDAGTNAYCAICTSPASTQKMVINTENVTIIGNNSNGAVVKPRGDNTTANIKAGTKIIGKDSYAAIESTATVNVYEGAELYQNGTTSYFGGLIGVSGGGTANIYGGKGISANSGIIAMSSGGTINVLGGDWTALTTNTQQSVLSAQNDKGAYPSGVDSIINVSGGSFNGYISAWNFGRDNEVTEVNITGGTFSTDPSDYILEGYSYSQNTDGTYTIYDARVAKIGDDSYYTTLQAAVDDAVDNDIIVLISDAEDTTGTIINKNVTIDLNNYTYTSTGSSDSNNRNFYIKGTANVEIKNGTIIAKGETVDNTTWGAASGTGSFGSVRMESTGELKLTDITTYNYRGWGANVKACTGKTICTNVNVYAQYGGGFEAAGGEVELNNCNVEQEGTYCGPFNSAAVSVSTNGNITVNGGNYSTTPIATEDALGQGTTHGSWTLVVMNSGGTMIINDGIFSNDNYGDDELATNARSVINVGALTNADSNIIINGGMFNSLSDALVSFEYGGGTEKASIMGGSFNVDPTAYLENGYMVTAGEHGNYAVVADDAGNGFAVTENITVSLEPTDNSNKYDVVLKADENNEIHRFLSAELNITLIPDENDETPISIKNIVGNEEYNIEVIKPEYNTSTIWGFHLGEATDTTVKEFTGSELTIATIELTGYGTGELTVAAHDNNKVQAIQSKDNNDVKFYTVDANTLVLPTGTDYVNLEVPTKDLKIEITFVNPIVDQVKAYQDMTVTVEGKDIETITKELGLGGDVQLVTSADGKIVKYVITLDNELTENNAYNITVTGAGYRTAEYRVTMTEDKTVYFWNDATKEGNEKAVEIGVSTPVKATFLAGDIAEDNIIDKYDLAAVVSYFGKYNLTGSDTTYKYAKYDLNRDGNIDSEDIAYVLASFGY